MSTLPEFFRLRCHAPKESVKIRLVNCCTYSEMVVVEQITFDKLGFAFAEIVSDIQASQHIRWPVSKYGQDKYDVTNMKSKMRRIWEITKWEMSAGGCWGAEDRKFSPLKCHRCRKGQITCTSISFENNYHFEFLTSVLIFGQTQPHSSERKIL